MAGLCTNHVAVVVAVALDVALVVAFPWPCLQRKIMLGASMGQG